jgi:hypothetical protein
MKEKAIKGYADFVDNLIPLQMFVKGVKGQVDPKWNPYILARVSRGFIGQADEFLENGTFLFNDPDKTTGKSLKEIVGSLSNDHMEVLDTYAIAKRAVEQHKKGLQTGIEDADAKKVVELVEGDPDYKHVVKAREELRDYQKRLLDYLDESYQLDPNGRAAMESLNEDYVPFMRLFDYHEVPARKSKKPAERMGNNPNPIKRFKGSDRRIISPVESIVRNTYLFINLANRNRVARAVAKVHDTTEGASDWVMPRDPDKVPVVGTLEEIRKTLAAAGADMKSIDLDKIFTIFRTARIPKAGNVIAVHEHGKVRYLDINNPDLYSALQGLDDEGSTFLLRQLSYMTRVQRAGFTTLSLPFAPRHLMRGILLVPFQSDNGTNPFQVLAGLFHVVGKTDLYHSWVRSGGGQASMISLVNRATLQKRLQKLRMGRTAMLVNHPLEVLHKLTEMADSAGRVADFKNARKKGKSGAESAYDSREAGSDAARRGARTRALWMLSAFWNIILQHGDKFARVHKDHPKRTMLYAALLAGASAALYYLNSQDPVYLEQPREERDRYWYIPTGDPKNPYIKLAKPFAWGAVYGSLTERAMEEALVKDPHAWDGAAGSIGGEMFPPLLPTDYTSIRPLVDVLQNKSKFTGRQIVPDYMKHLHQHEQYDQYTSEISKNTAAGLAKIGVEVSPRQLDYLIYNYAGTAGRDASRVVDVLSGTNRLKSGLGAAPVLSGFVVSFPNTNVVSVKEFYDELDKLESDEATATLKQRRGDFDFKRLPTKDAQMLDRMRNAREQMGEYYLQLRKVDADKQLSRDQKDEREKALDLKIVNAARRALGKKEIKQ